MAMNKVLKAKWVKALRSGKYKQIDGWLKKYLEDGSTGFCCLGVLQDICPTPIPKFDYGFIKEELLDEEDCGIPKKLQVRLAHYNDAGRSFEWIASNIERRKRI